MLAAQENAMKGKGLFALLAIGAFALALGGCGMWDILTGGFGTEGGTEIQNLINLATPKPLPAQAGLTTARQACSPSPTALRLK